jgi:formylmethanofuran dehydrogenase subunit C
MERMTARRRIGVPDMAAVKTFKGYRRETQSSTRGCRTEDDESLLRILRTFHRFMEGSRWDGEKLSGLMKGMSPAPDEVEAFTLAMGGFQHDCRFPRRAGEFLSAIINRGPGTDYTVHASHLDEMQCLGEYNRKNITVMGDVGAYLGNMMEGGRIMVIGSAGRKAGKQMRAGIIEVSGNARDFLGYEMLGGRIMVGGDALAGIGGGMVNGEILVRGNAYGDIEPNGGKITILGDALDAHLRVFRGEVFIEGRLELDEGQKPNPIIIGEGRIFHKGKLITGR